MKIRQPNKFLMITISLLVLVGCDNYEFVNTDEYLVVKKEETKTYLDETTWKGLSILSEVITKHTDGKVYYIINVSDIDGVPIKETDYFETLEGGYLIMLFRDKDSFELHKEAIKVTNFANRIDDNNIASSITKQGSFDFEESQYVKIEKVRIGTRGI